MTVWEIETLLWVDWPRDYEGEFKDQLSIKAQAAKVLFELFWRYILGLKDLSPQHQRVLLSVKSPTLMAVATVYSYENEFDVHIAV